MIRYYAGYHNDNIILRIPHFVNSKVKYADSGFKKSIILIETQKRIRLGIKSNWLPYSFPVPAIQSECMYISHISGISMVSEPER